MRWWRQYDGIRRYGADECGACHSARIEHRRDIPRLYREFDDPSAPNVLRNYILMIGQYRRLDCDATTFAPGSPAIEGTCLGPVALSKIIKMYLARGIDREMVGTLRTLFGFKIGPAALWNARRAFALLVGPELFKVIEDLLVAYEFVHLDETEYGHAESDTRGYAWVAACPWAARIAFRRSRSAKIFDEEFAFLRGLLAVVDGYHPYRKELGSIQRCWRHIMGNLKDSVVRCAKGTPGKGFYTGAEARAVAEQYAVLCGIFDEIKDIGTASEAQRGEIMRRVRGVAEALPEGHPSRTEILNAGETLVEFLRHEKMPATNNFCEDIVKGGPAKQRAVRFLVRNAEGAYVLGVLLSLDRTCALQGLDTAEVIVRILRGEDLHDIFKPVAAAAPPRGRPVYKCPAPGPWSGADSRGCPDPADPADPAKVLALPAPAKVLALPAPAKVLALPAPAKVLALPAPAKVPALPAPVKASASASSSAILQHLPARRPSATPRSRRRSRAVMQRRRPPPPRPPPCLPAHSLWRQRRSGINRQTPIEPSVPPPCSPCGAEDRAVRASQSAQGANTLGGGRQ